MAVTAKKPSFPASWHWAYRALKRSGYQDFRIFGVFAPLKQEHWEVLIVNAKDQPRRLVVDWTGSIRSDWKGW